MSAKLLKTLTAAHLNSLNSTISSLETQTAALKTVLKELGGAAPAKKGKKPVDEDEEDAEDEETDEEESDEEDDAQESDEDEESEESDEDEESEESEDDEEGPTKKEVIAALKKYGAATTKAKAVAVMKKTTGKDTVHDVRPAKYAALIKALKVTKK